MGAQGLKLPPAPPSRPPRGFYCSKPDISASSSVFLSS